MKLSVAPAIAIAATLLSACGGSAHISTEAATVAGQAVSRSDVNAYVRYAYSFYRTTYGARAESPCSRLKPPAICVSLGRQSLARLLEERIVATFARHHEITLGVREKAAVAAQLRMLRDSDPTTQRLLRSHSVTLTFLSRLLDTEALVRKVERIVTGPRATRGFSYHIHTYTLPVDAADNPAKTYRRAERLATGGRPVPASAIEHVRWVAAFRLPRELARSLLAANNGDFVGPFRQGGHYLVVRRLGAGIHAYGKPATQERETRLFKRWLRVHLRTAGPHCFDAAGKVANCPPAG